MLFSSTGWRGGDRFVNHPHNLTLTWDSVPSRVNSQMQTDRENSLVLGFEVHGFPCLTMLPVSLSWREKRESALPPPHATTPLRLLRASPAPSPDGSAGLLSWRQFHSRDLADLQWDVV